MERVRRDPGPSKVPVERQTADGRVSFSRCQNAAGFRRLLENAAGDRPARIQAVANLEQLRVQSSVETSSRRRILQLRQLLLFERQLSRLTTSSAFASA